MKTLVTTLTLSALTLTACSGPGARQPTAPSSLTLSVGLRVQSAGQPGDGRLPPIAVIVTARNGLGVGVPIVSGAVTLRDASGRLLAEASIPSSEGGEVSIGLAWPQEARGTNLELRIDIRDSEGTVQVIERTLAL